MELRETEKALSLIESAVAISPDSPDYNSKLLLLLTYKLGEKKDAQEKLKMFLKCIKLIDKFFEQVNKDKKVFYIWKNNLISFLLSITDSLPTTKELKYDSEAQQIIKKVHENFWELIDFYKDIVLNDPFYLAKNKNFEKMRTMELYTILRVANYGIRFCPDIKVAIEKSREILSLCIEKKIIIPDITTEFWVIGLEGIVRPVIFKKYKDVEWLDEKNISQVEKEIEKYLSELHEGDNILIKLSKERVQIFFPWEIEKNLEKLKTHYRKYFEILKDENLEKLPNFNVVEFLFHTGCEIVRYFLVNRRMKFIKKF
ncbi:MAG TPA: hypothetical protein PKV21_01350 [bacterium]|nr:hypothetical protein [bacterium]HOM26135.1 hypothetical protein [bacterium]